MLGSGHCDYRPCAPKKKITLLHRCNGYHLAVTMNLPFLKTPKTMLFRLTSNTLPFRRTTAASVCPWLTHSLISDDVTLKLRCHCSSATRTEPSAGPHPSLALRIANDGIARDALYISSVPKSLCYIVQHQHAVRQSRACYVRPALCL